MSPLVLVLALAAAPAPVIAPAAPVAPVAPVVAVDVVDVVPVAVGVVAGRGEAGPCGPRAAVTLLRTDVERFLKNPTSVPTAPRSLPPQPTVDVVGLSLPLHPGPGLFAGEGEVFAAAVDAALLKAKVTTTAPTTLGWREGLPVLRIIVSAEPAVVGAALRAFVPTTTWLGTTEAAVGKARLIARRTPGVRALEVVDARLCLGARAAATTTTLSPAIVRAALAAPLSPG